jgi:hypothetical protein
MLRLPHLRCARRLATASKQGSFFPWGLPPRVAVRLTPAEFDALGEVTLCGILDRPAWQRNAEGRAARAYADALITPRDLHILNAVMDATIGPTSNEQNPRSRLGSDFDAIRSPREALEYVLSPPPVLQPSASVQEFLRRATDAFRDVILTSEGLPLGWPAEDASLDAIDDWPSVADPGPDKVLLVLRLLHLDVQSVIREGKKAVIESRKLGGSACAAAVADARRRERPWPVRRVAGAKLVDACTVWDSIAPQALAAIAAGGWEGERVAAPAFALAFLLAFQLQHPPRALTACSPMLSLLFLGLICRAA